MRQRHPGAPAERAEAAIRLGAGEIVHRDRHGGSSNCEKQRHYGASLPISTTAAANPQDLGLKSRPHLLAFTGRSGLRRQLAVGVTDWLWTVADLAALAESAEPRPGKAGPVSEA
jgi:hypothetical protein